MQLLQPSISPVGAECWESILAPQRRSADIQSLLLFRSQQRMWSEKTQSLIVSTVKSKKIKSVVNEAGWYNIHTICLRGNDIIQRSNDRIHVEERSREWRRKHGPVMLMISIIYFQVKDNVTARLDWRIWVITDRNTRRDLFSPETIQAVCSAWKKRRNSPSSPLKWQCLSRSSKKLNVYTHTGVYRSTQFGK